MNILESLEKHIAGGFTNPCESHQGAHIMKTIGIEEYPFDIFCWDKYIDTEAFCPADDAVSQALDTSGMWESHVTELFDQIIHQPDDGIVIDIGAHVGWYACRAVRAGRDTFAVEANKNYVQLLQNNLDMWATDTGAEYQVCRGWVDELTAPFVYPLNVKVIKVDIEGNERFAFRTFETAFKDNTIDYAILEISPVFNAFYLDLIRALFFYGYQCFRIDQKGDHDEWTVDNMNEKLEEFPQVDCIFISPKAASLW